MPTEQQIENLRMAYSIMAGVPAEKVYLNAVRKDYSRESNQYQVSKHDLIHKCGTVGCIAGWLSIHPYFMAQGFKYSDEMDLSFHSTRLFDVDHIFDCAMYTGAGKDMALARLRKALLNFHAITPERNAHLAAEEAGLTKAI